MSDLTFFVSKSPEDIAAFAGELLSTLQNQGGRATLLGLTGELGAGKTTLTQSIAGALGITERVTSPTYVILKIYETTHPRFTRLVHIDAYRLSGGADLRSLGWNELLSHPETLVVLEWPEKVADILPDDIVSITIDPINETTRNIEITGLKHGKESNT